MGLRSLFKSGNPKTLSTPNNDVLKERIICSAIIIQDSVIHKEQPKGIQTGFVVCGRRHGDCYKIIENIVDLEKDTVMYKPFWHNLTSAKDMGFITNTGRFVNRKDAMKIAMEAGQLINPKLHEGKKYEDDMYILTSEDLFLDE